MAGALEPQVISPEAAHSARVHIGVTSALLVLGVGSYALRMWLRIWPVWRIGIEDYCITLGIATAIVDFGFLIPEMVTTPGTISGELAYTANKYSFLAIPVWGIAMMFIKISIALMLLKIQDKNLWWRIFCWFMIAIQLGWGIGNTFFILLQCRPLEAAWNPAVLVHGGSCLPVTAIITASNVGSGINISTDILLSLAPLAFLWKLRRPLREKVLIGFLMGLGMFASVSSIMKTTLVKDFNTVPDTWERIVSIATWTMLEQLLAMIVASAPYLKPILQSGLQRFGISVSETKATGYGAYGNRDQSRFTTPRAPEWTQVTKTREWTQVSEPRDGVVDDEIPLGTRVEAGPGKVQTDIYASRSWDSRQGSSDVSV